MAKNVVEMLEENKINIVKVTNLTTKKFIMYKEDKILNYKIESNSTKADILDDIIYIISKNDINWYHTLFGDDELSKDPDTGKFNTKPRGTFKKGLEEFKYYLSYNCYRVNNIINDPAQNLFFEENGVKYFNLFQNTKYLVEKPNEYKDWNTIKTILFNLCGNNKEYFDWVLNWFACLYNKPTYRFSTSIIFIGDKGSGKGMFSEALMKIFGKCAYRANSKDLTNNFNSQLFEGKLLLIANEIIDQKNKYQFSNDLKEFVTEKEISVEKKFSDRYMCKNYIKLVLFSNSNQPISIEEDDRRYAVFKSQKLHMSYAERKKYWDDEDNYFTNQVEGFCSFLNNFNFDLSKVVSEPIMTPYKQDIIDVNKTDFNSIIYELIKENNYEYIYDTHKIPYIEFKKIYDWYCNKPGAKITTANKFGAKLRMENYIVVKKTIDNNNSTFIRVPDKIIEYYKERLKGDKN